MSITKQDIELQREQAQEDITLDNIRKWFITGIITITVLIVFCVGVFPKAHFEPSYTSWDIPHTEDKPDPVVSDLKIVTTKYGSKNIVGFVSNTTDAAYSLISVSFTLYDADSNVIGSASDMTSLLPAGEKWKFSAYCFKDNFSFARLVGVNY